MTKKRIGQWGVFILVFIPAVLACEKELDLDVPTPENKVVVDGYIEAGRHPVVYLTQSFPFFEEIDEDKLFENIVAVAKVTVSTDDQSEILTLERDTSVYPPFYYTGIDILGEPGKRYDLRVDFQGNVITASTTIPPVAELDSLWFIRENDSLGYIRFRLSDNAHEKNYYRTFYRVLGKDDRFVPSYINALNDRYFNGQTGDFSIYKNVNELTDLYYNDKFFEVGQNVRIKIASMDKAHFDFWNSFQGKNLGLTSFTAEPGSIESNVNGGLGVWGGYGSTIYSIVLK